MKQNITKPMLLSKIILEALQVVIRQEMVRYLTSST